MNTTPEQVWWELEYERDMANAVRIDIAEGKHATQDPHFWQRFRRYLDDMPRQSLQGFRTRPRINLRSVTPP